MFLLFQLDCYCCEGRDGGGCRAGAKLCVCFWVFVFVLFCFSGDFLALAAFYCFYMLNFSVFAAIVAADGIAQEGME